MYRVGPLQLNEERLWELQFATVVAVYDRQAARDVIGGVFFTGSACSMRNYYCVNCEIVRWQSHWKGNGARRVKIDLVSIPQHMIASLLRALNLFRDGFLFPPLPREIKILNFTREGIELSVKKQKNVIFEHGNQIA